MASEPKPSRPIRVVTCLLLLFLSLWGGCSAVPAYEQAMVSKPGMIFSDSLVASPRVNLQTQIEAGTAVSGGAQAAGCTACR